MKVANQRHYKYSGGGFLYNKSVLYEFKKDRKYIRVFVTIYCTCYKFLQWSFYFPECVFFSLVFCKQLKVYRCGRSKNYFSFTHSHLCTHMASSLMALYVLVNGIKKNVGTFIFLVFFALYFFQQIIEPYYCRTKKMWNCLIKKKSPMFAKNFLIKLKVNVHQIFNIHKKSAKFSFFMFIKIILNLRQLKSRKLNLIKIKISKNKLQWKTIEVK